MTTPLFLTDLELICKALGSKNPRCALAFMDAIAARLRPIEERGLTGTQFTFQLSDFRPGCAGATVPAHDLYLQVDTVNVLTGKKLETNTLYGFDLTQGQMFDYSHCIIKPN
jgi:hypothetical protein